MSAVGALTVIGSFIIYSATRPRLLNRGVDPFQFVQRQIIFVIIAIVAMAVVMWMDYVQLRGSAELFYAITIATKTEAEPRSGSIATRKNGTPTMNKD